MKEIEEYRHRVFEKIRHQNEYGAEFWYARELADALGYGRYDKFENVVKKAIVSCKSNNIDELDHFSRVGKMVEIGKGAKREIKDWLLSRYACYLIVQNADPRKEAVALGQSYFAIQTLKRRTKKLKNKMLGITDKNSETQCRINDARRLTSHFSLLTILLLLFSFPLFAVTVEELQSSGEYLCGRGESESYEKATELALQNLIGKISVQVEADFERHESEDESGYKNRVEKTIRTYSSTTLYNVPDIMEAGRETTVVWRYIKKEDVDKIFADRKRKILSYYKLGIEAESKQQIGDALRNYYWSKELLKTHPEEKNLCADGEDVILQTLLPVRINTFLNGVSFNLQKIINDEEKQRKIYKFAVKYAGKAVVNLNYRFYRADSGWSRYNAVNDGLAYMELPWDFAENQITVQIQYRYERAANFDKEVQVVLTGLDADYFSASQRDIMLIADEEELSTETVKLNVYDRDKNESVEKLPEKEVAVKLLKGLREGSREELRPCFTEQGYEDFLRILCYGRGEILENETQSLLEDICGEKQLRGIPMRFSFPDNEVEFIERVNFKFDENNKVKGITFGLGDRAIRDIMAKDETIWKPEEKYHIINFMEYYKTAYCLEDIDFIDNVFAENALIIVGRILQKDDLQMENITQTIEPQKVEYIRYKKDEYIQHLRQVFAANEYVNLQFEDNNIQHFSNDADSALYAIQIKQNYYSTNYGDQGYLFLMMDLHDIKTPKIYIRSWQPEKFSDGTIFGVDDFSIK